MAGDETETLLSSPSLSSAGNNSGLGVVCCWFGADTGAAGTADKDGVVLGLTLSIGFCSGVLTGVGVGVTSTSSSTVGCLHGSFCPTALTRHCDVDRVVDLVGLEVEFALEADILGDPGVDGGVGAESSSRVTFCWEKREEAEEDWDRGRLLAEWPSSEDRECLFERCCDVSRLSRDVFVLGVSPDGLLLNETGVWYANGELVGIEGFILSQGDSLREAQ